MKWPTRDDWGWYFYVLSIPFFILILPIALPICWLDDMIWAAKK